MADTNDVVSVSALAGMPVLSLSTGNKLGCVSDVRVDPVNGTLVSLTLEGGQGAELAYEQVYSFGSDAVMATSESSLISSATAAMEPGRRAKDLIGTKVVMESGEVLGEIADVLVTLKPPPGVVYEIRRSMLDRLLGRTFFIPASVGYALSDDAARLVVPDRTAEVASTDVSALAGVTVDVRSFPSSIDQPAWNEYEDETVIRDPDGVSRALRYRDDDETLLIREDEDETVVRRPIDRDR